MLRVRAAVAGDRLALLCGRRQRGGRDHRWIAAGALRSAQRRHERRSRRRAGTARRRRGFSGDAEIAGRYRELFALARPDFEEELSRLVGDVPARRLSQFAQGALSWARSARASPGENLAEYLQEESRDLVSKPELEEFLLGVDQLRETADRVEARLARLEQRLRGPA